MNLKQFKDLKNGSIFIYYDFWFIKIDDDYFASLGCSKGQEEVHKKVMNDINPERLVDHVEKYVIANRTGK